MNFAGLDIGGANIKLATLDHDRFEFPFAFWKQRDEFPDALRSLQSKLPQPLRLGVTMTAELADCFASKQEGVEFIVQAIDRIFPFAQPRYYSTDGRMFNGSVARQNWRLVAAANWHAAAWFAFRQSDLESGFFVDVGSTTTDVIPVVDGFPQIECQTDLDRLANGQLLYAGIGRTPICSLLSRFEFSPTSTVSAARECFATIEDALLWLGETPERPHASDPSDGRPMTRPWARSRLARMVCADSADLSDEQVGRIADQSRDALVQAIDDTLNRVVQSSPDVPLNFRIVGRGSWLAREIIHARFPATRVDVTVQTLFDNPLANQAVPALATAARRQQLEFDSVAGMA